jgi:hypothetical protein
MSDMNWANILDQEDVEAVWNALYQLIARHPGVRPLHFATDGAAVASAVEINADLTQELFLELFQKKRFDHYLNTGYTSTEIENEIAHIEVPNLVGARLRKRYPESFRMARRVSSLLKTSSRFKRVNPDRSTDTSTKGRQKRGRPSKPLTANPGRHCVDESGYCEHDLDTDANLNDSEPESGLPRQRMVNQIFGLKEWARNKPFKDSGHFTDLIKNVPMRIRDTRFVGRSASSQLILSNPDLEKLIIEVLQTIDSPADVRTLRQLVLSRIPLQDYNVASLDEEFSPGTSGTVLRRDPSDSREGPEAALLRRERDLETAGLAGEFLKSLRRAVNDNDRRYSRLLSTLWHCYYDPEGPSQLEIAQMLGVSDSLISDNRRLIEFELRKLRLSVDQGVIFSESLQRLIGDSSAAF